jgi:hypothetical protein
LAREVEDRLLGLIDEALNVPAIAVTDRREVLTGRDDAPQPPLLLHQPPVRLDVRDGRNGVRQLRQIRRAADLLQQVLSRSQPATVTTSTGWLSLCSSSTASKTR